MRYAHWDGAEWIIETLEADNSAGSYSDLALDSNDLPHLIFQRYGMGTGYYHWDGAAWTSEILDEEDVVGRYPPWSSTRTTTP